MDKQLSLVKGEVQINGCCKFIGYSMEISNIQQVQAGYVKVTKKHPEALHVMCAFRFPGDEHYKLQGYMDNKEAGRGRTLYQLLLHSEIYHRALYVVRYYSNTHLGPSRFQSIATAAKSAISRSSMNCIIGQHQFVKESTKPPRSTQSIRGRRQFSQQ